jgi:hypothetical protein
MRIPLSVFVTLLAVSAVPSIAVAQVVSLRPAGVFRSFDHAVPVATVSLVGDIVALDSGRIVQDSYGEPFVLGAATLDVSVPYLAKVVFKMTNVTEKPIPLKDVHVFQRTMVSSKHYRGVTGAPYVPLGANGMVAGYPGAGEELQPGASVTVEIAIPPLYCARGECHADGFVVFVSRYPRTVDKSAYPSGLAWEEGNAHYTRAFLALLSQARQ